MTNLKTLLTAGRAETLLEVLYVLMIAVQQTGENKPEPETADELKRIQKQSVDLWGSALPSLQSCISSVLKGKDVSQNLAILGTEIKTILPEATKDKLVPTVELELLKAFSAFFRTASDTAAVKLQRFASKAMSPWVTSKLAPKATNQTASREALNKLIYELTGVKDATSMSIEECKTIKETHPEEYRQYLELRKAFNQSWKDSHVAYIRNSGQDKVDFDEVKQHLEDNGIEHSLPKGFKGKIDDMGRLYTENGELIDGVPNAATFPTVKMNPNHGKKTEDEKGDWVFKAIRNDGSDGPYYYTLAYKKQKAAEKFKKVADLEPKIEAMRNKWFRLVKNFNPKDPHCVAATILELLYEFSARIGTVGNSAGGKSTYGIATLLVKSCSVDPSNNITIRYRGKDGVPATHKLLESNPNHKPVIKNILELMTNKVPNARLFTVEKANGGVTNITPAQVNALWKSLGAPEGVTVHKIRTCAGTKLFRELITPFLEKWKNKQIDDKTAMAFFKKCAEAVGKKLNHIKNGKTGSSVTGTTAIKNYIDASLQQMFFLSLGLRLPKFLESEETFQENA